MMQTLMKMGKVSRGHPIKVHTCQVHWDNKCTPLELLVAIPIGDQYETSQLRAVWLPSEHDEIAYIDCNADVMLCNLQIARFGELEIGSQVGVWASELKELEPSEQNYLREGSIIINLDGGVALNIDDQNGHSAVWYLPDNAMVELVYRYPQAK